MNPLWLVAAAIVVLPAVPIAGIAFYRWRRTEKEKALSFRKKEKISIVREGGSPPPPRSRR